MDEKSGTAYCISCAREFHPSSPDVLLCPDCGKPTWTEENFKGLLYTLGCAGCGWLREEGVRKRLDELAATKS